MAHRSLPIVLAILLQTMPARAEEPGVIATMDTLAFRQPAAKGQADLVEGKVGKAVRFRFDADARSTLFTSNLRGTPEWDKAAGFSFWVKGEGKDGFGGIEFIYDEDYAVRYDVAFPVRGTEWTKVTVAWDDLVAILPGPRAKPLGSSEGNPPSKLSALWVGKWWYWGDYPALSFAIDEVRLEARIDRPAPPPAPAEPTGRVLAKLKAGKPITVVTMGDSLTDVRHWANRERAWPTDLKDALARIYRSDATIIDPAIGGTQLKQGLVLIPTWLARAPEPDLVTIFFGGNDRAAGMTGEAFERACVDAVDRVRRATGGRADVLLMTTAPSLDAPGETADLASAVRRAARVSHAGLAEVEGPFLDAPDRKPLYVHDKVHLGRAGHETVAQAVLKAIGGKPPKPEAQDAFEPRSGPGAGQAYLKRFEGDWTVAKAFFPRTGEPVRTVGTCRQGMIHDGRFLQSDFVFGSGDASTTGKGLIGFEAVSGLFTSVWTDSRRSEMSFRQGKDKFDGNRIVLYSNALEPEAAGARRSKTVTTLQDGDRTLIHRQYAIVPDGSERLMMELVMTRK